MSLVEGMVADRELRRAFEAAFGPLECDEVLQKWIEKTDPYQAIDILAMYVAIALGLFDSKTGKG